MDMIYVFKTSVLTEDDVELLRPYLEGLPQAVWSFDLEDCDSVLRIESQPGLTEQNIINVLQDKGFDCEALPD